MFDLLLSCKFCGLKYVGSKTDKFGFRWNNYNENGRKALKEGRKLCSRNFLNILSMIDKLNVRVLQIENHAQSTVLFNIIVIIIVIIIVVVIIIIVMMMMMMMMMMEVCSYNPS